MNHSLKTYVKANKQYDSEQLILDHIPFVRQVLGTMSVYISNEHDRENLVSAGTLGLVQAAHKFDRSRGKTFRSFAFSRIRGAILDELRKLSPVPQNALRLVGLVNRAYESIESPVTPEKLAKQAGIKLEEVEIALEAMRFMDSNAINDLHGILQEATNQSSISPESEAETNELHRLLVKAVKQLPKREQLVITMYYSKELTLAEIGAVLDVSESRVSRILATARFRLQESLRSRIN